MLILTRRMGETLMVGDDVTVTILGIKGNQVRLGINAPMEISVHREEIYEKIQREKREAAGEPEPEAEPEPIPELPTSEPRIKKPTLTRAKFETTEVNGNF